MAILKVAGPDTGSAIDSLKELSAGVRNNVLVFQEFGILAKTSIKSIGKVIGFLLSPLTSFGENVVKVGIWVWENWSKIWENIGETVQFALSGAITFFENAWTKLVAFIKSPSADAAQALIDTLKPTELGQQVLDGVSEGLDLDKIKLTKPKRFIDLFNELEKINSDAAAQIEKLYNDAFDKVVQQSKRSKALVDAEGLNAKDIGKKAETGTGISANLATAAAEGSAEAVKILARTQRGGPEERTAKNTESIDKTLKRSLGMGTALVPVNLGAQ